ncbi:hypothetical protein AURDEDRAFT_100135 [Auricularia subglabra TFB-10046 SS5]|nr:hypothetical protein AURDEDRAFT_100135 [Auricularia subglabra TFB-10046 SS5]
MSRGARDAGAAVGLESLSMRDNYAGGVAEYYTRVGTSYRNPHLPGVRACVMTFLNAWWKHEQPHADEESAGTSCHVLDMACGSGEVTLCAREWAQLAKALSAPAPAARSMRRLGPVAPVPAEFSFAVTATDPYTGEAFRARTGSDCLALSFEDIANESLPGEHVFELVFVSFALHLVPDASGLFSLLWALSSRARWLVVIGPHKKPEIKDGWGWVRWDVDAWGEAADASHLRDTVLERVHLRVYRSRNA